MSCQIVEKFSFKMKGPGRILLLIVLSFYDISQCNIINMKIDNLCPCSDVKLCEIIQKNYKKEVFAYSLQGNASYFNLYPWDKLTMICPFMDISLFPPLMCLAHSKGVRILASDGAVFDFVNATAREAYIDRMVKRVTDNFLDGFNFDHEDRIAEGDAVTRDAFTATVKGVYDKLKAISPYYQVTVDVSWKPNEYGRFYDYYGLSQASDFLMGMFYDEPMRQPYAAGPNSGLDFAKKGISLYNNYPGGHIPNSKLVMGVPWYGDLYQCAWMEGEECFRPAGSAQTPQWPYSKIYNHLLSMPEAFRWNGSSSTPYLSWMDNEQRLWQIQYDNPWSTFLKYRLAAEQQLRGIAMWTIDFLDYNLTDTGARMRADMFATIDAFTKEEGKK